MKLSTTFDYNHVQFDKNNEVILMASVKAPKISQANERPALDLSLVLDVSGSMAGDKLENLKKSVTKFIEQMSDKDIVGIVTFTDYVDEPFPSAKMTPDNKAKAISAVQALRSLGGTNLSGGMLKGFEQLRRQDCPLGTLHRVLLFTDGQANSGLTTKEQFSELVQANLKDNTFSVSCFGYGTDHSEEILKNIADPGKGSFYYIGDIAEIAKTFARELGGLLSCYAQNISVTLEMKKDSGEFIEVLNDLTVESTDPSKVRVIFDDIYSEEEKHLLVKLRLNGVTKAVTQRESTVVTGQIHFSDLSSKGAPKHENFKAKIKFVKEDAVQKDPTIKVIEQLAIVELGKAHLKAREAADRGDFTGAQGCYGSQGPVGIYTSYLVSNGSALGTTLTSNISNTTSCLNSVSYDSNASMELGNSARGMSTGRSYNASTDIFSNSSQKDMADKFQDLSGGIGGVAGSSGTSFNLATDGSLTINTDQIVTLTASNIILGDQYGQIQLGRVETGLLNHISTSEIFESGNISGNIGTINAINNSMPLINGSAGLLTCGLCTPVVDKKPSLNKKRGQ